MRIVTHSLSMAAFKVMKQVLTRGSSAMGHTPRKVFIEVENVSSEETDGSDGS